MNGYLKNNEIQAVILKTERFETIFLGKVLVLYHCLVLSGKDVYSALGRTTQEAQRYAISKANKRGTPEYTIS